MNRPLAHVDPSLALVTRSRTGGVAPCYMMADMDSMQQSLSSRGESAQDAEMDRVHAAKTLNEKRA
jgi:hypothetical protein